MNKPENVPVLVTEKLCKDYGKARGITDVDLTVSKGEIYGFIGPNGAGKSTTIRSIMGLLFPGSGSIRLFGKDTQSSGAEARKRIGYIPSEINYYDGLKAGELLRYSAAFYPGSGDSNINHYSEVLKLDLSRTIKDLSLGNRRKVAIIQALIHKPDLLVLDEPTSGLDPLIQSRFYDILRQEQSRGCTVFFSSHTLSEIERLCSRVSIISEGKIIKTSSIEQLKQLQFKRFHLTLQRGVDYSAEKLEKLIPGCTEIDITANGIVGIYKGDLRVLMKKLSELPLSDVVLEDPGLDEIFLNYYNREE